jgi:hypothetical protein
MIRGPVDGCKIGSEECGTTSLIASLTGIIEHIGRSSLSFLAPGPRTMNQVLGMVSFTIDDRNSYSVSTVGYATGLKRYFGAYMDLIVVYIGVLK